MLSYELVHTRFDSHAENRVSRLFTLNKAEAAKKKKKGVLFLLERM